MRTSCLMLLVASATLFASSFMTWIQFRPELPFGMDSQMMDAEMLAMLTATGWRGNVSLASATVPTGWCPSCRWY